MKKLSLAFIALSLSLVSIGQTAKKTTKTKKTAPKTEKKVEKTETVAKAEETAGLKWYTDLSEAQAAAKKSGKPLMLFFTGSDWCGWCKRLDAEVFSKPEFKTWSDNEVIMLVVDFPRASILSESQKTQNMKLQQQFGIRGYPTIVFANVSGDDDKLALTERGRTGYLAGGPATWIANANTLIGK